MASLNPHPRRLVAASSSPLRQKGAVLYVALVLLIILSLIGVTGMQVTGLQERMSANYIATNLAFQNAEAVARNTENTIGQQVSGGTAFIADREDCDPSSPFSAIAWADGQSGGAAQASFTRRIDRCFPGSSQRLGIPVNEQTNQYYQISAFDRDRLVDASSEAVIDTVFIP